MDTEVWVELVTEALEADGYAVKEWQKGSHHRLYLKRGGKDVGFLRVGEDDGSTGTCKAVTRRAGHVKELVREALAEAAQ